MFLAVIPSTLFNPLPFPILTISLFLIDEIISSLQKYKMSQLQQQSKQFLERKLYMEAIDTYLSQPNYVF